ncbi:hypothetical protein [Primorskyibacter sedentarius]|uniref:DUF2244 domain-containing protein n=1 Tax=Primorskyibacter sedentarius TaxID=745311 RepID=A0A4R3IR90_9RHOB|nr:hypothetical protein [Primorskyibacter sedentarius]TCS52939.1 hypothetical protein EDD52_13710 [Primorskyibacter sedentarius]
MQDDEVLARAGASAARRVIGVAILTALGGLLLYVALTSVAVIGWQVFLVICGALALWAGQVMWRATSLALVLTREELRDSEGTLLARMSDITHVDRGAFAFKPSNGFMIKTESQQPRGWRPGIWWRLGRRVAIGGVIPSAEAKFMADMILAMKAGRV